MGRELARYKMGIAALSEIRLVEEGQLKPIRAGYTAAEDRRKTGVGFSVKNADLVSELSSLPRGINDRLMTMKLSH